MLRLLNRYCSNCLRTQRFLDLGSHLVCECCSKRLECVHATHDAIRLIDELVDSPVGELKAEVTPRATEGVGAVEAPRGLLIHHYAFDEGGTIVKANCVVPTTQNNANIHHDLEPLVAQFATDGMTDGELELLCSMLVRAYDPCVSCSVH